MQKNIDRKNNTSLKLNNQERETQIINVICNTTILLMSIVTEALTSVFTKLSKEMITSITSGLGAQTNTIKEIDKETNNSSNEFPKQIRAQLLTLKIDITAQLREKKEKLASIIADSKFDEGIAIIERYNFNFPKLSCDLDEHSLLGYFALLQNNDEQFTKMFKELLEWMNNLPQP